MSDDDLSAYDLNLRKIHLFRARRALPGPNYYEVLSWIHEVLKPATYVEIGVHEGDSLQYVGRDTICVGVDPAPDLKYPAPPRTHMFTMTSNEFFARHDLAEVLGCDHFALAFIDGLHLFEQALLDFIHLERFAGDESFIILHDCLPLDSTTSGRTRTTHFYSGDVWKLTLCIRELRPDLWMTIVPTAPTGLCLVSGLDRRSSVLSQQYDECLARYGGLDYDDYRMRARQMPPAIRNVKESLRSYITGCLETVRR